MAVVNSVSAADYAKQQQQTEQQLIKKLAAKQGDFNSVSLNPADTMYLFTNENDWPFGIPHVTCFRDAKVDVGAYFGLKAACARTAEHIITGYSAASKLENLSASALVKAGDIVEDDVKAPTVLGRGKSHGAGMKRMGTTPDLLQSHDKLAMDLAGDKKSTAFAMPNTTPAAKAIARKENEEKRLRERERTLIGTLESTKGENVEKKQASASAVVGLLGEKKSPLARKPQKEQTLAQRQKTALLKLNMRGMAMRGQEMGEVAMHAKQFAREVMQFALKAETQRNQAKEGTADFFSMENKDTLNLSVDGSTGVKEAAEERNPLAASSRAPLEKAFWEGYRLSNAHADFCLLEESNTKASTYGEIQSERILEDTNIRGMEFSRKDPRAARIDTITFAAQKDMARREGISEAVAAMADKMASGGGLLTKETVSGDGTNVTVQRTKKRWREEDQVASKRMHRSATLGTEGLFGDLKMAGSDFPRGFATSSSHCPKKKGNLDLKSVKKDIHEYGLAEQFATNQASQEKVQVYRGGERKSLFKSRVKAEQFIVPLVSKDKTLRKFLTDTSLTEGVASKVAAQVRYKEMLREHDVEKELDTLLEVGSEAIAEDPAAAEQRLDLEKRQVELCPVPAERTRPVDHESFEKSMAEKAEANEAAELEAKAAADKKAAEEAQSTMSDAMRKKMEAKFAAAMAEQQTQEFLEENEAEREARLAKQKKFLADEEMRLSHRRFFPHYEELKKADRVKFHISQRSLAERMAVGDPKKTRQIQFSYGRNMPCLAPSNEEVAISYLNRKVRQQKNIERKQGDPFAGEVHLENGEEAEMLRGFGDGFLGGNFDPTPDNLGEVYPNPKDADKMSARQKMMYNHDKFSGKKFGFDPLPHDPKKGSKLPPNQVVKMGRTNSRSLAPKQIESDKSGEETPLPPIIRLARSGLAQPGETTDYELGQRISNETKDHWQTHERQTDLDKQQEQIKRDNLVAKCNKILAAIAPELVRSEAGEKIAKLKNNPQNRIAQLDKFVAAAAAGYLDMHTIRTMPGDYWRTHNHHPDMIGFMHQRKEITLEDVTQHLSEYIKTRAAIEHREAVLLYGRKNVVVNTQKKIMDLLLGLGSGAASVQERNRRSQEDTSETLVEQMKIDAEVYNRTRSIQGIGDYRTDRAARLRRHFNSTLGAPRKSDVERDFMEQPTKSRVAVLASLSEQAIKRPLFLPPAKTFRTVGNRVDENTKAKLNPKGTQLYAEVCQLSELVPRLREVHHPDEGKFDISGTYTTDNELLAMSFMLTKRALLEVNFSENTELSDEAVVTFLRRVIQEGPTLFTLKSFKIAGCTSVGDYGLQVFIDLIPSLKSLRELDFSGIRAMAPGTLLRLADEAGARPLHKVVMSDIEMPGTLATRVLESVLANDYLKELDVGWNAFGENVFVDLRTMIAQHKTLEVLRMPNCAEVTPEPEHNPIHIFLEGFGDYKLKYIDLSINRCTMKSCCILEAALYQNRWCLEIDMNNNPIGAEGCRSLFRAFSCHPTMQFLGVSLMHAAVMYEAAAPPHVLQLLAEAAEGNKKQEPTRPTQKVDEKNPWDLPERVAIDPSTSAGTVGVNYSLYSFLQCNPQRSYLLNMDDPGHRAILRLLFRIKDRVPGCAFIGLDDYFMNNVAQQANGGWNIVPPEPGSAEAKRFQPWQSFRFELDSAADMSSASNTNLVTTSPAGSPKAGATKDKGLVPAGQTGGEKEVDAAVKMLAQFGTATKSVFTRQREVFLGNIWLDLQTSAADQKIFLDALSFDFEISNELIAFLIARTPHMRHQILCSLFGALRGGKAAQRVLFLFQAPTDTDMSRIYLHAMQLLNFVPENPMGHYKLSLDSVADWGVADMMMKIDAWEFNLVMTNARGCKAGPPKYVVSQHGNKSNFRNEQLNGHYFEMHPNFQLPMANSLTFDYSSPRRPPVGAVPIADPQVELLMRAMTVSNCCLRDCRDILLQISPKVYLTCRQLRRLLNVFQGSQPLLLDVIVILMNRTVDWYLNEKIVRAAVWSSVWKTELHRRVGSYYLMPWVQPENWTFELDFRYYEDRLVLQGILAFEAAEDGENILDVEWDKDHDGTPDLLVSGIPRSWETEVPKAGLLRLTYACAPEFVQLKFRLKMASQYGFWNIADDISLDQKRIEWWMSIEETPEYILDIALVLMHKFPNLKAAFKYLDRYKRRQINLQDIKAQFSRMRVNKRTQARLQDVFRFLDRGGEGQVSYDEFKVFSYLWSEMFVGLEEFIYHLRFKMAVEKRALETTTYRDPRRRRKEDVTKMKGVKMVTDAEKQPGAAEDSPEDDGSGQGKKMEKKKSKSKKAEKKEDTEADKKRKMQEERKRLMERVQPGPVLGFLDQDFEPLSLAEAWDIMDTDGGGSLSQKEFISVIGKYQYRRQNVGIIYNFLDADGDEIERHEWMSGLEKMMKKMRDNESPASSMGFTALHRDFRDTQDLTNLLEEDVDDEAFNIDGDLLDGEEEEEEEDFLDDEEGGGGPRRSYRTASSLEENTVFDPNALKDIDYGMEDEIDEDIDEDALIA
ncbi:unnamed protein product [Amoebophrya sp. A120]|nr:unnamed protein product [Amoebophrya sp. A120]|eukprot:GSA120T00003173001.1